MPLSTLPWKPIPWDISWKKGSNDCINLINTGNSNILGYILVLNKLVYSYSIYRFYNTQSTNSLFIHRCVLWHVCLCVCMYAHFQNLWCQTSEVWYKVWWSLEAKWYRKIEDRTTQWKVGWGSQGTGPIADTNIARKFPWKVTLPSKINTVFYILESSQWQRICGSRQGRMCSVTVSYRKNLSENTLGIFQGPNSRELLG